MQGSELRDLRKRAGMTQGQLAEHLGFSLGYIGELERGEKGIERRTELLMAVLPGFNVIGPETLEAGWAVVRRHAGPRSGEITLCATCGSRAEAEAIAAEMRRAATG